MLPSRWISYSIVQLVLLLLVSAMGTTPTSAEGPYAAVVPFKGIVNPAMATYVDRAIAQAEESGASVIIIEMDTPGGLDTSMRDIIQRIIASRVPVVVYVAPNGSRAASAGVYITYAAHIAALAPSTNIGSAHPVALGDNGSEA
ncbi:MAG TPA: nodulation protein NfeD, partial [Chloroflexota bacterium]|nr:nodulation protein NfeD [Chloroflexota bacterium]